STVASQQRSLVVFREVHADRINRQRQRIEGVLIFLEVFVKVFAFFIVLVKSSQQFRGTASFARRARCPFLVFVIQVVVEFKFVGAVVHVLFFRRVHFRCFSFL